MQQPLMKHWRVNRARLATHSAASALSDTHAIERESANTRQTWNNAATTRRFSIWLSRTPGVGSGAGASRYGMGWIVCACRPCRPPVR